MSRSRILYTKPSITEREVELAADAARHGWGNRCYEYIEQFERLFRAYVGTQYAIATSSCTGALHMGLAALGIGPGDEVIMADTNWIASAAPISHLGAKPVFVDILHDSWCIDPALAEAAITPRTKAILAVHLYGNLCAMDRLLDIGKRHNLPIIEDAAEAIGSHWHTSHAGSMGRFGTFSFHGTKTLTTGEGGMFVTNDGNLYERVLTLSNHGRARGQTKQFWPDMIGFKYKMSNIQAAIGCGQMERIHELVARKREIFGIYKGLIGSTVDVMMNPEPEGCINGFWMPNVVFGEHTGVTRETALPAFKLENIDARVFFHPLSSLSLFSESAQGNSNAYGISARAVNLPSHHDLTGDEQGRVAELIHGLLRHGAHRK